MKQNLILAGLAIVLVAAIAGGYYFPSLQVALGSPAGTTFSNAKVAQQTVVVSTSTVFSILNSDASDRTISAIDMYLANGAATSSIPSLRCATSTVATGFTPANTNWILNQSFSQTEYGTSTGTKGFALASTSPGLTGTSTSPVSPTTGFYPPQTASSTIYVRNWASGSYLVCENTNSGSFNGANTLDAGTTGYIGFRYWGQ